MALNRNTAAPKFEDDTTKTQANPTAAAGTTQPAAASTTAIAATAPASLPALGGKFNDVFKTLANALPTLDFGTIPRIIGAQGAAVVKGNGSADLDLGETIDITLLSFNDEFCVSPGSSKDEDKKHVKYSRDGKTIEGTGESVNDYLNMLRTTLGLTEANVKRYVHLVGTLDDAQKKPAGAPFGDMVCVSLSPQSVKKWEGYRLQESVKAARGASTPSERVRLTAVKKSAPGLNWVELHASASPVTVQKAA